jgi:hypothetical protein
MFDKETVIEAGGYYHKSLGENGDSLPGWEN